MRHVIKTEMFVVRGVPRATGVHLLIDPSIETYNVRYGNVCGEPFDSLANWGGDRPIVIIHDVIDAVKARESESTVTAIAVPYKSVGDALFPRGGMDWLLKRLLRSDSFWRAHDPRIGNINGEIRILLDGLSVEEARELAMEVAIALVDNGEE